MPSRRDIFAAAALAPLSLGASLGAAAPASAAAGAKPFDPRDYQAAVNGPLAEVLVLGSPHLSGAPEGFDPKVLEPLLARLDAFGPDVIAFENLSGEDIFLAQAYAATYPETAKYYGGRTLRLATLARLETGLDQPAGEAAARKAFAALPAHPTPAQRRELATLLLASGDTTSAVVQWWSLPAAERKAGDGITAELARLLDEYETRRNETHLIGARLAVRRGHPRVWPIDDHSGDDLMGAMSPELEALFQRPEYADKLASPAMARLASAAQRLRTPEETLETYRELNRPETCRLDADLQWKVMLTLPGAETGRRRVAEWEARNLRMAANIREAMSYRPAPCRVLAIVGSAHKAWIDAYLAQMTDVRIVDVMSVLK